MVIIIIGQSSEVRLSLLMTFPSMAIIVLLRVTCKFLALNDHSSETIVTQA